MPPRSTPQAPRSLGASSVKYGACEVCGQPVADVHILRIGNDSLFGHEDCLRKLPWEAM
jgi:hypothetical protein